MESSNKLKRGLSTRHIRFMALGSAIGTGLFYGSADAIKMAGPSVLLAYIIGGVAAYIIMRALGEMSVHNPAASSFSRYAQENLGGLAGYITGWTYCFEILIVAIADVTAFGIYMGVWFPTVPHWIWVLSVVLIICAVNLMSVKVFGELEFWFSIVKVAAIISMIAFGCYLLFSGHGGPAATVANLWQDGGFFPNGITGLVMAMAVIMFSFGGLELVGITAAEADEPHKTIPKATNQVIYRILLFYVGSLAVLMSLYPWRNVVEGGSPFVLIFHAIDSNIVANALNLVVLTAALSVYNSCVYCNSRMLYGLAAQGDAPKVLMSVDRRGVPVLSILVSALITFLCVIVNYVLPHKALELLMSLVVAALVINWAMISLAHMKFRRAKKQQGVVTRFPALFYPLGNWLCLLFMAAVLVIMLMTPGMAISVWLIPVWIAVLGVGYLFKEKAAATIKAQ